MNIVAEILGNGFSDKYDDNVFWFAKRVVSCKSTINVYVDEDLLVGFSGQYDDHRILPIGLFHNKIISKCGEGICENDIDIENVLVSSGSILWINDLIIVKRRTDDAPYDPGAWTTAAGRCDFSIYETGVKETKEEIEITDKVTKEILCPEVFQDYSNQGIKYFSCAEKVHDHYDLKVSTVNTYFRDRIIETKKMWHWYDRENNTLEFRIPLVGFIDAEVEYNNAEYDTEARAASFSWLKTQKVVPVLKQVLSTFGGR
ncbi:hypothetical protein [uncultured Desulfuromusa sp.]|uniref:hypothetical protein n=1 Tax=uncultured Desulfuromusa sp. TaxID=219183 RepID=UPI002AA7724F|nr:hypothetical protein [uncultured Desulfuromusa sp.]